MAVQTGFDTNHNGNLDHWEVTNISYVCAHKTLLREDTVGSGTVCTGGGVQVRSGLDVNDNGALEDSEIKDTATVCYSDEIYHGDLKTSDFAPNVAVKKLGNVRVVTGNLVIDNNDALPNLEMVGGNLQINDDNARELPHLKQVAGNVIVFSRTPKLEFPALTEVGGTVQTYTYVDGTAISMPSLTTVGTDFKITGYVSSLDAHQLKTVGGALDVSMSSGDKIELPALERVNGSVYLSGAFKELDMHALEIAMNLTLSTNNLTSLSLPALKTSSLVRIAGGPSLTSVQLPSLSGVKSLGVQGLPKLTTFELPQVTELESLSVSSMALTNLSLFANLRSINTVRVSSNSKLVDLGGLDQLTTAKNLTVSDNPKLESLAGLEQLTSLTGSLTITHNATLKSLSALDALTNVTDRILINSNPKLSQAEVDAFLKRLGR